MNNLIESNKMIIKKNKDIHEFILKKNMQDMCQIASDEYKQKVLENRVKKRAFGQSLSTSVLIGTAKNSKRGDGLDVTRSKITLKNMDDLSPSPPQQNIPKV